MRFGKPWVPDLSVATAPVLVQFLTLFEIAQHRADVGLVEKVFISPATPLYSLKSSRLRKTRYIRFSAYCKSTS